MKIAKRPSTGLRTAVFAAALALAPGLSSAAINLIPDASMEKGSAWKPNDAKSSVVSGVARTGTRSIRLMHDAATTNHNIVQANIPGIVPGREYVYTVYVQGDNIQGLGAGGKPMSVLRWRDGSGGKLLTERFMWAPYGTYGWFPLTIHFQAPTNARAIDVGFRAWHEVTGGRSFWDDASLMERQFPNRGALLASYQAEDGIVSGGAVQRQEPEFTGSGYVKPNNGGSVKWTNVSGGANGGKRIVSIRYAHEGNARDLELFVNGVSQGRVKPIATGRISSWASLDWDVTLRPGDNTIELKAIRYTAGPLFDKIDLYAGGGGGGTGGGGGGTTPPPMPTVLDPTFSPDGGTHQDSVDVQISTATAQATIHYTLDGSTPSASSTAYGGPFTLTRTRTVKAVGIRDGYKNSAVVSKRFIVETAGAGGGGGAGGAQSPYGGQAWAIPGRIEAEDYDVGGNGTSYRDTSTGNTGAAYRSDDVDIWRTADSGGGFMVGATPSGEWLEFTVDVASAGEYMADVRVASAKDGRTVHLEIDGVDVSGPMPVPNTGAWQNWTTISQTVTLSAGQHIVRLAIDQGSANINFIEFKASAAPPPGGGGGGTTQAPFGGTAWAVPGTVQAEDYDEGGEGVAYHDATAGNKGGTYRDDDVDIWKRSTGPYVGAATSAEWLEYTIDAKAAGPRTLRLRAVARKAGKIIHVELNGKDVSGPISLPSTGSWQDWQVLSQAVSVPSTGVQTLRLVVDKGPVSVDWIRIE